MKSALGAVTGDTSAKIVQMSPARRTARMSVIAAAVLIAIKLAAGLATNSLGFLSEAAHSGSDLVAALLTRLGHGERVAGITDGGFASGRQRFELTAPVPDPVRRRIAEVGDGLATGAIEAREP